MRPPVGEMWFNVVGKDKPVLTTRLLRLNDITNIGGSAIGPRGDSTDTDTGIIGTFLVYHIKKS